MDSLDKHVEQISFRQWGTFFEHGQLKGWPPHFQPTKAKNSISTILHCFMAFVTWKHGADFARFHNNLPWRPQTKKSNRNFTVTGISCLDQARTANFGYRKFMKIYGQKSFESITDFNSIIEPDDVRAGLWLPTQYFTLTGSLKFSWVECLCKKKRAGMDSWNQPTCPINFLLAVHHI